MYTPNPDREPGQVEAVDRKFNDIVTVATIKEISGADVNRPSPACLLTGSTFSCCKSCLEHLSSWYEQRPIQSTLAGSGCA